MPENVVLQVKLNGAESAIAKLTELQQIVTKLKQQKVTIDVKGNGLQAAANQARRLNTNLTNASKSAANLGNAANQAAGQMQNMGKQGSEAAEDVADSAKKASRNMESFRLGITNVVGTMAKFRLASAAINLVANAFKEAFTEIKAVDKEMVNVQKVTGFSATQMKALEKNAYSLATQYGRAASEVMEASTVFARAGYTDQIEQLSELSLLLQNVGDLNAEDASKFIIATDKAYGLAGSYEDLIKVIDGLDNITNKNATDMQKMTEGMTIAGSVFAQSGESIETFAAMLGVATSDTQRSGSEMARGLRTILMNIRQIRGETEDGELINGESIAAAAKALKDYAGISTMENGQLRKSSDVLSELAGKWDELNETQRSAIAEAVAGKRQANVLYALMGDWSSYEKMLMEYQTGAGTAAKENAIYMESWAAKTEQLNASWTELISTLTDTGAIKGALTDLVTVLQAFSTFTGSSLGEGALSVFWKNLKQLPSLVMNPLATLGRNVLTEFDFVQEKLDKLKASVGDSWLGGKFVNLLESGGFDTIKDAWMDLFGAVAAKEEETFDLVSAEQSRYDELVQKADALTWAEQQELAVLEQKLNILQSIDALNNNALADADAATRESSASATAGSIFRELQTANAAFLNTQDLDAYVAAMSEIHLKYQQNYDDLINLQRAGKDLTTSEKMIVSSFEAVEQGQQKATNAVEYFTYNSAATLLAAGASAEQAAEYGNQQADELAEAIDAIPSEKVVDIRLSGVDTALSDINTVNAALGSMGGGGPHYASGTRSARGGAAVVNERGPELIAANGLAWIAGGGRPTVTMLPKGATVLTAEQTRRATGGRMFGALPAFADGTGYSEFIREAQSAYYRAGGTAPGTSSGSGQPVVYSYVNASDLSPSTEQQLADASAAATYSAVASELGLETQDRLDAAGRIIDRKNKGLGGGYGGSGGGGSSGPNFKALEGDLSDLLKNLDLQAQLAENEDDYVRAMQVYGQAQDAIAALLEQYRAAGYAEDSNEVLTLANKGYSYASKQLKDYDTLRDRLIDALEDLTRATEDANELAEKQAAVDKAREALANAQKQRTVRVFNPVTGQWEWIANAEDVNRAQENLAKAEEALQKEELDQAINALKNADGGDLSGLTLSPAILQKFVSGTPEQQAAFISALNGATGGADYLGSEAGQTAFNQGSTTNIGAQYNLAGITLTDQMANGMTIAQLLEYLQGLRIM